LVAQDRPFFLPPERFLIGVLLNLPGSSLGGAPAPQDWRWSSALQVGVVAHFGKSLIPAPFENASNQTIVRI
jgi:hypothetical protein